MIIWNSLSLAHNNQGHRKSFKLEENQNTVEQTMQPQILVSGVSSQTFVAVQQLSSDYTCWSERRCLLLASHLHHVYLTEKHSRFLQKQLAFEDTYLPRVTGKTYRSKHVKRN